MSIELVMLSNHLILCCLPFFCLQSSPASGYFLMNWLFTSGGQSIRASASVCPVSIQGWFPLGWTGLISLLSKGLSRVFSNTTIWQHQFFGTQPSLWSNSHMTTGKTIALTVWAFVYKVMCLLFNTLSRFVRAFLSRSKFLWIYECSHTLLWWVEPKKIKSVTVSMGEGNGTALQYSCLENPMDGGAW